MARECQVSVKTVQEYYQILEDTFIAYKIEPWTQSLRKRLIAHPRYYLFDTGITNALCQHFSGLNPKVRGRRFEQFIVLQILALNSYHRLGLQIFFWRTHTGLEVDILLAKAGALLAAIEVKSTAIVSRANTRSLMEFSHENPDIPTYIVCTAQRPRILENGIQVLPWQEFLDTTLRSFD